MLLIARLLRPIAHIVLILGIFYLAYSIRLQTDLIPGIQLRIPPIIVQEIIRYAIISAIAFVWLGFIKWLYGLYRPVQNYFTVFGKVRLYWLVVITFIAYFGRGSLFTWWISRIIIIFAAVGAWLLMLVLDLIRNNREQRLIHRHSKQYLIIAEDQDNAEQILQQMNINTEDAEIITPKQRSKYKDNEDYHTTIAIGTFDKDLLQDIMDSIRLMSSRFFHVAEWYFLEDIVYQSEALGKIVALEYKASKLDNRSVVIKRVFDILTASFAIVLLSPLLLIIGIIIKLDSPGPMLYIQKRVGKYGELFTFIKFRSMYTHLWIGENFGGAAAQKIYNKLIRSKANTRDTMMPKIENDPRVTRVGRFIRKTSLDELPNLFCVWIGSMSIVWPRPHLPNEIAQYKDRQKRLLSIKPGITWYAQVFGRDKLSFNQEAKLDLYYIQHRSIFLDLYVIIMTIKVLFRGR